MKEYQASELLNYLADSGIIDLSCTQEMLDMKKRKELLEKHPYSIWQGKDGKWYTYLPDETKARKKALVKRLTREALEKRIVEYWENVDKEKTPKYTFNDVYFLWRQVQDQLVVEKTSRKYDTDYERFFRNSSFAALDIQEIDEDAIRIFMRKQILKFEMGKEQSRKLFGYISNTILTARKKKLIEDDPVQFLKAKDFYKYCFDKSTPIDKKVLSQAEMDILYEQFEQDHLKKPNYIPTYAVEFATLTGMRVGEIAALSWDRITDDYIIIDRSEKSDSTEKNFWIANTKNSKNRIFPMTAEIKALLDRVKTVEMEYGYYCEWVFADENGRIHKNMISYCMKAKCRQAHITQRGIHAFRKTLNSRMRCNGVPVTVAAALLGHSEEVNRLYYTFDVTDIKEKSRIISEANKVTRGNTNTYSP